METIHNQMHDLISQIQDSDELMLKKLNSLKNRIKELKTVNDRIEKDLQNIN